MKQHTLLKRVTAAALLSATIAAPGIVGLTAATANAKPGLCSWLQTSWESSLEVSDNAFAQGDYDGAYTHLQDALYYQNRFNSAGCS